MKPATAKVKGRETENLFVEFLRNNGLPHVERRRLAGSADRGDITGVPGVCFEVKSGGRIDLAGWMHELGLEQLNDHAEHGVLVIRPKGRPAVEDWWAVLTVPQLVQLLSAAGWIIPAPTPDDPIDQVTPL